MVVVKRNYVPQSSNYFNDEKLKVAIGGVGELLYGLLFFKDLIPCRQSGQGCFLHVYTISRSAVCFR